VLTVGAIEAGRDNNVIPGQAVLRLNTRWFSQPVREQIVKRVDEVNAGVALAAGVPADRKPRREMKGSAGPLSNDKALVARVNPSLRALLGNDRLIDQFLSVLGSEDFQEAFVGLETPYVFALVGVAPPALFAEAQKAAGRSRMPVTIPTSSSTSRRFPLAPRSTRWSC
jgi:hippurate hydrolase